LLQKAPPKYSSFAFQKKTPTLATMASSQLRIITEKTIDLHKFTHIHDIIEEQDWEEYLSSLKGPIYPHLVKELWKNASIKRKQSHTIIRSKVIGVPVTISPKCIAEVIKCSQEGIDIEKCLDCHNLRPKALRKIYDFFWGSNRNKRPQTYCSTTVSDSGMQLHAKRRNTSHPNNR
jgi:hypothetical protein